MKQDTQSQSLMTSTPQVGKNKVIVVVFITAVIIGAIVYFWATSNTGNNKDQQNAGMQNQFAQSSSGNSISTEINPKDYSLVELTLENIQGDPLGCDQVVNLQDRRLVKGNKVIVPSLIHLILDYEEAKQNRKIQSCDITVNKFLVPANGRYLYLDVSYPTVIEASADKFYIYRLDLSNLSIKELFSNIESLYDNNLRRDNYKLLQDRKRIIGWDMDRVYLGNLEKNTLSNLYTVTQNQSLVSREEESEVVIDYTYEVVAEGGQVTIGLYDKNKFQSSKTTDGYLIKNYTLINRITIPIPAD